MPVYKVKLPDGSTGYQWGRTGKIYKDPRKAYALANLPLQAYIDNLRN